MQQVSPNISKNVQNVSWRSFFFFEERFFKKEEKQLYQLFYILHSAIILKNYFTFLLKNLNLSLQWAQVNVL